MRLLAIAVVITLGAGLTVSAQTHHDPAQPAIPPPAAKPKNCSLFAIDDKASQPLSPAKLPPKHGCKARKVGEFSLPDPKCTPGSINPTLTEEVLKDPKFRTGCVRNDATSEGQKAGTYIWYHLTHPANNQGQKQTCELDHLVPLYLGGADTLDNIWPQCGPKGVALDDRYFKQKDNVEFYLGQQVRQGKMTLTDAQHGIATDWTQYIADAEGFCASGRCDFHGQ